MVGIVRDKLGTEKRVAEELGGRSNITILQADITVYDQLKVCVCVMKPVCVQVG